jgi:hypothetical protein
LSVEAKEMSKLLETINFVFENTCVGSSIPPYSHQVSKKAIVSNNEGFFSYHSSPPVTLKNLAPAS